MLRVVHTYIYMYFCTYIKLLHKYSDNILFKFYLYSFYALKRLKSRSLIARILIVFKTQSDFSTT